MNEKQLQELARALMSECSAKTLKLLGDVVDSAGKDGAAVEGLKIAVDAAREMRQEGEQRSAQDAAKRPAQTLGEALTRDRAAGRR